MTEIEQILQGVYENHVLPFLWQKGESHEIIATYLEKIKESDIAEICLESRPHPSFCQDDWWKDLAFIIDRCKTLGLKIWLLDDSHFPTGYANGLIKERYPQHRKTILTQRTLDVVGPQRNVSIQLTNIFDPTEAFYGAVLSNDQCHQDVSAQRKEDRLLLDIPAGLHQVTLLFTSRKTPINEDYINMVDKESCDVLIEAVYEPHYAHFKEEFGETILGFFSDEPGFMNEKGINADSIIGKESMPLPWSKELEKRLKKALGDTYLPSLLALWRPMKDHAVIRHTYMDIATRLYQECFDENVGAWCRARNVMHIGHVIEDKGSHSRLGVGAGHFFRSMAGQDMAGVDIVINQLVPGMDEGVHSYGRGAWDMEFFNYALAKLGSSLGQLDPLKKGRCMAEVFGAFGWHEGLKEMKWIADHFLVRGVNYYVPHAFSQAPFPDWDCPPHFYAHGHNPQFRYFGSLMTYLNKMSTLLSNGKAHPTAAILYHGEAEWCGSYLPMQKVAKELARHQIDFSFVPADVFRDPTTYHTTLDEHGLSINGTTFTCFILPYCEYIGSDVQAFLNQASQLNFPVYLIDQAPEKLYDRAAASVQVSGMLTPLAELAERMQEHHHYEIKTESYEPWLRYYHYTKDHSDVRLFVNEHPKQQIHTRIPGLKGTLVDVMSGELRLFDEELILEPYEALVLVPEILCEQNRKDGVYRALSGSWQVSFADAASYPVFGESIQLEKLCDMSECYPQKAGTFRYAMEVQMEGCEQVLLLEEAYETVEVFIDQSSIGHRIAPPYRFILPPLHKGIHQLHIEVTNTLDKQVTDMFSMTEASEPSGLLGSVLLA